ARRGISLYNRGLKMLYRVLADVVVLLHTAFVVFVVGGGFLAWRWRWVMWAHVPCALWGSALQHGGWIRPRTPLGNAVRPRGGRPRAGAHRPRQPGGPRSIP